MAWAGHPQNSVVILIPHNGTTTMEWAIAFKNLIIPPGAAIACQRYYPLDLARDVMAAKFLENPAYTWSIWLDSDTIVPPDAVIRLLNAPAEYPILSGVYPAKKKETDEKYPAAWRRITLPNGETGIAPLKWDVHGYQLVDYVGFGIVRVHRSVFAAMKRPYFFWTLDRFINGTAVKNGVSEDFWFLDRARELGFQTYVDMDLRCAHSADAVIDENGKLILARV